MKLIKSEVPSPIADAVLDLKPLLEQVVQVVRQKQESRSRVELRADILHEHQCLVSFSQAQVVVLEEKDKEKIHWQP